MPFSLVTSFQVMLTDLWQTMNSLLTIETDNSHRVTRHHENWNHERTSTSEDGFLGELAVSINLRIFLRPLHILAY